MPLIAAAVCPHPPLLVPTVGRGIDVPVRASALSAVERLVARAPDVVVLVGADEALTSYDGTAVGSFAPYGVDERVALGEVAPSAAPTLPLALTVGAWLLQSVGWTGRRAAFGVPESLSPEDAVALGRELAAAGDRVALLCLGDLSARRTEKAPGWLDERARGFDADVAAALGSADLEALVDLDVVLARELLAVGRASWQVLAGAAAGMPWGARVLYDDAPFGVGYVVAEWRRAA